MNYRVTYCFNNEESVTAEVEAASEYEAIDVVIDAHMGCVIVSVEKAS